MAQKAIYIGPGPASASRRPAREPVTATGRSLTVLTASALLGVAFALLVSPTPAYGAESTSVQGQDQDRTAAGSEPLTASELVALMQSSGTIDPNYDIKVVGTGPHVTVLARVPDNADGKELKIDAVFMAKSLVDGAPDQVSSVKVIFAEKGKEGCYVKVDKGLILDYGAGKMSAEDLLRRLQLLSVVPEKGPELAPGPFQERRLIVWQRIETLREKGTGVQPFEALFQKVEAAVKAGADDVGTQLAALERVLTEQEEQVAQARRTASGKGVSAPSRTEEPIETVFDRFRMNFRLASSALKDDPQKMASLREMQAKVMAALNSNRPQEVRTLIEQFDRQYGTLPVFAQSNGLPQILGRPRRGKVGFRKGQGGPKPNGMHQKAGSGGGDGRAQAAPGGPARWHDRNQLSGQ